MSRIYLDHAAATPMPFEVRKIISEIDSEIFANASSLHEEGRGARAIIDDARFRIAQFLSVQTTELVFTSGATESNHMAIVGVAEYARSHGQVPHVVLSKLEHASSMELAKMLARNGVEISWVENDGQGFVDPGALTAAIKENTVLVSVMWANNETGTMNDIAALSMAAKSKNPQVLFHTDASQAVGWVDFKVTDLGVDLLSASSHKLGGPKGVGLLYIKSGIKMQPLFPGTQEWGKRAGTEPVSLIAGFAKAWELSNAWSREEVRERRNALVRLVTESIEGSMCNTPLERSVPHIAHFSFTGIDSQLLTIALDRVGLAASPGSACSSGAVETSHVVEGLGIDTSTYTGHLRLSLGAETTDEEIHAAGRIIIDCVADLRSRM
jgi:cysteine desulfurase